MLFRSVIGFLNTGDPVGFAERLRAFHEGLGRLGFVEGRNVAFEYIWTENRFDRLPELAERLVAKNVDVIVAANGIHVARVARAATDRIPVLFVFSNDPVAEGLVASLARPGANVTGINTLNMELAPKRLEIVRELFPAAKAVVLDRKSTRLNSSH